MNEIYSRLPDKTISGIFLPGERACIKLKKALPELLLTGMYPRIHDKQLVPGMLFSPENDRVSYTISSEGWKWLLTLFQEGNLAYCQEEVTAGEVDKKVKGRSRLMGRLQGDPVVRGWLMLIEKESLQLEV